MMVMDENMLGFDYRELFAGEIINYNKYDIEYAIKNDLDITEGVIERLNEYNNTFHIVKALIRAYWGRISYIIDNPKSIIDFIKERNPTLFEVQGAEQYIKKQIQKVGYALVEYIEPSAKVKVKLDLKAKKFKNKMEKKD
jgi:hypothetical protein